MTRSHNDLQPRAHAVRDVADEVAPTAPKRPTVALPDGHVQCPWCTQPTPMHYVHGHAQCVHCRINIAPCCEGERAC